MLRNPINVVSQCHCTSSCQTSPIAVVHLVYPCLSGCCFPAVYNHSVSDQFVHCAYSTVASALFLQIQIGCSGFCKNSYFNIIIIHQNHYFCIIHSCIITTISSHSPVDYVVLQTIADLREAREARKQNVTRTFRQHTDSLLVKPIDYHSYPYHEYKYICIYIIIYTSWKLGKSWETSQNHTKTIHIYIYI